MSSGPAATPRHQLGSYREYDPPAALAVAAEASWSFRTDAGITHRVLPDPAVSLAFWCRRECNGRPIVPRLTMIGAKTRPHLVCFEPGCEITAVRIKLEWVRPMLGVSPADHADGEHDLPALFPSFALTLFDELVETTAACQVAAVLEAAVARRLRRTRAANDAPGWALDLVRRTNGRVAIERIAGRMGVSLRHLRRMVRRDAGVSLKGYARTHRLVAAMTEADRSTRPGWARLAVDSGFYDQSHLVRECQALCSLTPVEVHRERRLEAELSNPA